MRIVQLLLALVGACGGLACAGPTTPARAWPYVVTLNAGTCVEFMFGLFKKDYTEISFAGGRVAAGQSVTDLIASSCDMPCRTHFAASW